MFDSVEFHRRRRTRIRSTVARSVRPGDRGGECNKAPALQGPLGEPRTRRGLGNTGQSLTQAVKRRPTERLAAQIVSATVEGQVVEAIDLSLGGLSFSSPDVSPATGSSISGSIQANTAQGPVTARFNGEAAWSNAERCLTGVRFAPMNGHSLDNLMVILSFLTAERDRLRRVQVRREWLTDTFRKLALAPLIAATFAACAWATHGLLDLVLSASP